jgi:pyruvate,orthophosphate dikinase
VSGTRTPDNEGVLDACAPAVAAQLRDRLSQLEREFGDVQDVEFTIEDEKLWILQTRSAKRTPLAAVKFAVDFVKEGLIMPAEASRRLDGIDLGSLACRRFADAGEPAACGIAASTGVAVGRAAFDSESAQRLAGHGDPVILMRPDTSTADVAGFAVSAGIVTAAGGRTAHASLVARQMGKPCVVGCAALSIDDDGRHARLGDNDIKDGDWISVDGDAGAVYRGQRDIVVERPQAELAEIARWRADAAA